MIHIKNTMAGFPAQTRIMHVFNTIQMMEILNFYQIGTHKKYFVYHTSIDYVIFVILKPWFLSLAT